ncbi:MAG: Lcl C-terminal domain-containing protein [Promethearchaeota archaeon]
MCILIVVSGLGIGYFFQKSQNAIISNSPVEKNTDLPYAIVDTNQNLCNNNLIVINSTEIGNAFFGQDAQYDGLAPSYKDNQDGTVTDLNTGLMWQQDPGEKVSYYDAVDNADEFILAGYDDWRLPTIKELYSLIVFTGTDPSGMEGDDTSRLTPFIDTDYFVFKYGDTSNNERIIDSQYASSTTYVSDTIDGGKSVTDFGVNFADGRIKGYGTGPMPGQSEDKTYFVMYVRGNSDYGINDFIDNEDGTITDNTTNLMWSQNDSGVGMNWEDGLSWVQQKNVENYLGYSDWRLPNIKELQSIVDYTRSPDTTDSAAINQLFKCTVITDKAGMEDYAFYWSSTTHASSNGMGGSTAYVAFGEALGYMMNEWIDVHGAGAQRSDPKVGDLSEFPEGHGPQGDAIRIFNYLRLVRTI